MQGSIRSYAYSIASTAITLILGLLTSALVNRFLGPLARGELASISYATATSAGIVAALVSQQAIIAYIGKVNSDDPAPAIVVVLLQSCLCVPIAIAMLMAFHQRASVPMGMAVALAVGIAIAQSLYNGLCAIHRAQGHFRLVAVTVVLIPSLYAMFLLAFIGYGGLGVVSAAIAGAAPILVALLLVAMPVPLAQRDPGLRDKVRDCIRLGMTYFPVTIIGLLVASTDRALILHLGNLETLGYFTAAAGLSSPIAIAAEAIVQVSFVEVSRRVDVNDARAVALLRFRAGQVVLLGLGLILAVVGPWFLTTASGVEYAVAVPVLYWLILAMIVRALVTSLDSSLRAVGHLRSSLICTLIGVLAMVVFGVILIPQFGAVGAAQMVLAAYVSMLIGQVMIWRYSLGAAWGEFWGCGPRTLAALAGAIRRASSLG